MKKIGIVAILFSFLMVSGCKQAKKENTDPLEKASNYMVVPDSTSVKFTAYKTTEKLPVGGMFKKADLDYKSGTTIKETIDGMSFSIPVNSLFTNDATKTRDPKILEFFFGMMDATDTMSGTIHLGEGNKCIASFKMNGITADLPMVYDITSDNHVQFSGTMKLGQWKALEALASLNEACKELHMAADGISKTWDDVDVTASVYLISGQ